MRFTIPNYKVPSWNKLYSGTHWTKRKKMADEAHSLVEKHAPQKMFNVPVDIHVKAHYRTKRKHDSDNIAAKLLIDGLCGIVIEDDDTRYVRRVISEAIIDSPTDFIEIIVTPLTNLEN